MREIQIQEVAHHRNGVCGAEFWAVTFTDPGVAGTFVATMFPTAYVDDIPVFDRTEAGDFVNPRIAVLNIDLLPGVQFGVNSWRGDEYGDALAIELKAHLCAAA